MQARHVATLDRQRSAQMIGLNSALSEGVLWACIAKSCLMTNAANRLREFTPDRLKSRHLARSTGEWLNDGI